jgi:hypothetical protein
MKFKNRMFLMKSRGMKKGIIVLGMIVFASCGSYQLALSTQSINYGMSKADVFKIMGNPGNRQFMGKDEAWQYCATGGDGGDTFYIIWFYDGKVTGVSSYQQREGIGMCDKFYKTINWEDKPTHTIEIRER